MTFRINYGNGSVSETKETYAEVRRELEAAARSRRAQRIQDREAVRRLEAELVALGVPYHRTPHPR